MPVGEQTIGEEIAILDYRAPINTTPSTVNGAAIDMRFFRRLNFKLLTGVVAATATMTFKLQGSADGSTDWQDITGKAITALDEDSDDLIKQIDIQAEENRITADNEARRYVRWTATVGTANALFGVVVEGNVVRYGPASNYNIDGVAESVN